MAFNAFQENKIQAKISEFTVLKLQYVSELYSFFANW